MKLLVRNVNNPDEHFITSEDVDIQRLLIEAERESKLRSWNGYTTEAYKEEINAPS